MAGVQKRRPKVTDEDGTALKAEQPSGGHRKRDGWAEEHATPAAAEASAPECADPAPAPAPEGDGAPASGAAGTDPDDASPGAVPEAGAPEQSPGGEGGDGPPSPRFPSLADDDEEVERTYNEFLRRTRRAAAEEPPRPRRRMRRWYLWNPYVFFGMLLCAGLYLSYHSWLMEGLVRTEVPVHVHRVLSGNQITVKTLRGQRIELKLKGVEPPADGQSLRRESTKFLQSLLMGRSVKLTMFIFEANPFGSSPADLFLQPRGAPGGAANKTLVQHHLLREGLVWHDGRVDRRPPLVDAMKRAQEEGKGIWGTKERPVPPWIWKRRLVKGPGQRKEKGRAEKGRAKASGSTNRHRWGRR